MTTEERIALAKKTLKAKEEAGNNTYIKQEYEEVKWLPLIDKGGVVCRLAGESDPYNRETPVDPKIIFISDIIGDDKKNFKLTLPDKADSDHIFYRIEKTVLAYDWDATKPKGQNKVYKYAETHSDLVNRILHNGKKDFHVSDKGALAQPHLLWNVIDYSDSWCRDNKHSKLLSKQAWVSKKGTEGCDTGLGGGFFKTINDTVIETFGWYNEYQTVITKDKDKSFGGYNAYNLAEEKAKVAKLVDNHEALIKSDFSDEADYELYNLDELYKLSTYSKIKKVWGVFIQAVDKAFGTEFAVELDELIATEKAEWEANKPKDGEEAQAPALTKSVPPKEITEATTTPFQDPWTDKEEVVQAPVIRTPAPSREPVKREEVKSSFSVDTFSDVYPWIQEMREVDKAIFTGFDAKTDTFIMDVPDNEVVPCGIDTCKKPNWSKSAMCIYCGQAYDV